MIKTPPTTLFENDNGSPVGRHPKSLCHAELAQLGHLQRPSRAIRLKCLDCCGENAAEVRKCVSIDCPLWPHRMGTSPFYGNGGGTD